MTLNLCPSHSHEHYLQCLKGISSNLTHLASMISCLEFGGQRSRLGVTQLIVLCSLHLSGHRMQ